MLLYIATAAQEVSATPNIQPAARVQRINGTDNDAILIDGENGYTTKYFARCPNVADNTNYWRFKNTASIGDFVVAVIQQG